jgi:hypothetical protein
VEEAQDSEPDGPNGNISSANFRLKHGKYEDDLERDVLRHALPPILWRKME